MAFFQNLKVRKSVEKPEICRPHPSFELDKVMGRKRELYKGSCEYVYLHRLARELTLYNLRNKPISDSRS